MSLLADATQLLESTFTRTRDVRGSSMPMVAVLRDGELIGSVFLRSGPMQHIVFESMFYARACHADAVVFAGEADGHLVSFAVDAAGCTGRVSEFTGYLVSEGIGEGPTAETLCSGLEDPRWADLDVDLVRDWLSELGHMVVEEEGRSVTWPQL